MAEVKIDTLIFKDDELDYEANGGNPLIVTSFGSTQIFDSYWGSKKIYKPNPGGLVISLSLSLLIEKTKVSEIYSLITKQLNLVKQFRESIGQTRPIETYSGFSLSASGLSYEIIVPEKVWLSSFTTSSAFIRLDSHLNTNIELIRCKLDLQEAE